MHTAAIVRDPRTEVQDTTSRMRACQSDSDVLGDVRCSCWPVVPVTNLEQPRVYNRHMSNIVITGTSRGIGFATALELARAGHEVVATMRNPAGSPELRELAAKEKLPVRIETMDVNSDESVKQAFAQILARGPVDVLVNN